jgi:diacylglycerol O-acyltransferase / trehalose O-mycolyltransferase
MRSSAVIAVVLLVSACSAGSPSSGGPGQPSASSATPSPTRSAAPSKTPAPTEPAIGEAADDGARIVKVTSVDARTRDLTIDSPAVGKVLVRLLIPNGFEAQPETMWPALYLLHGADGSHLDWTMQTDVEQLTEPTDLLVVMPDAGGHGFYSDWWNGGQGGPPMWETFHTSELIQLVERNWHASDRRVVAGLSMGGYGAMEYAARHPGMYLAAASYSGAVDLIGGQADLGPDIWGDPTAQADVWRAHDPVNIAAGLTGIDLYVSYGDGQPGPLDLGAASTDDTEVWIHDRNVTFVARLKELKVPVTVDAYGAGSHTWPYWERALHRSLPLLLKALGR